jgi:phosphoribosyl 1,2-cyclic phosphodiesterase
MKIRVVSSGSVGNSYILESDQGEVLLLELGVRFSTIKKALNFKLSNIVGGLVSHCHQDHSKGMREAANAGIDIYCLKETSEALRLNNHRIINVKPLKNFTLGGFLIKPFPLEHNVPSLGFMIDHSEMGLTVFITDTQYCAYRFPGIRNLILEANYCQDILDRKTREGSIHNLLRTRIMNSHMSFDSTKEFLKANDLKQVNNILLIHLSDSNSDADRFKKEAKELTRCNVEIATKGLLMDFNHSPF